VIPFCQIDREGVLGYLRRFPDGRIMYRLASSMLGARDLRTIRRHLAMGTALVANAALALAALLSEVPVYATVPQRRLGQSDCSYLEELAEQTHRGRQRACGGAQSRIPSLVYVHLVDLFSRCCGLPAPPLTRVLNGVVFHDTS